MWNYEKRLQYPVHIQTTNPRLAQIIIAQYGGPDGEIGASLRYLSQRYTMPCPELKAILTDIGTEELAHLEMVATIVYQLTRNLTEEQIREGGYGAYFVNHTSGVYPCNSDGAPFSAAALQVKGDPVTDIHEDLAAEQKARSTYDNILRLTDDPDVLDAIRFLREREVVHYQRFGEGLRIITDSLDERNFYAFNPAFDLSARRAPAAGDAADAGQTAAAPAQKQP
jgi:spore coat protein JC